MSEAELYLSWEQIERMSHHGITFGNHTTSHLNLPRLPEEEQYREFAMAGKVLRERIGRPTSAAHPFGLSNNATRKVSVELGYESIMGLGGVNHQLDLSRVAQVPMAAASTAAFFAELEVVTPIKGRLKRWTPGGPDHSRGKRNRCVASLELCAVIKCERFRRI